MIVKDYQYFTNHLKINLAKKSYFFDLLMTTKVLKFTTLLLKAGLVRRLVKVRGGIYRVYPNWSSNKPIWNDIRFFQKKTPLKVTYKALRVLNLSTFNSTVVLSTPRGLLNHHEALRYKVGGNLVCLIF